MTHPNHPLHPDPRHTIALPGGETLTIDGSTVLDPETGYPVPAAVLRLPVWRAEELAAALHLWSQILTLVDSPDAALPDEQPLATALADLAPALA
jgi:hypothetical protein